MQEKKQKKAIEAVLRALKPEHTGRVDFFANGMLDEIDDNSPCLHDRDGGLHHDVHVLVREYFAEAIQQRKSR